MMEMANMEEAVQEAFDQRRLVCIHYHPAGYVPMIYRDGFAAGAAWARRQAKIEGSSQAVGTMSPEVVRVLISQFVVWAQMKDLWLCRLLHGACPDALLYHEVPPLWKEFAAELYGGGVVSQYPAAVEEPEEEVESSHRCLVEPDMPWPRK